MEKYVIVSPRVIRFDVTLGKQTTTTLHLQNISDQPVAYKVKTTQIRRYCVKPNTAVLQPQEAIEIALTQQSFKEVPSDLNTCRDRFLLQIVSFETLPDDLKSDHAALLDMWKTIPQDCVLQTKFNVSMNLTHAPPETPAKSITATTTAPVIKPKPVALPLSEISQLPEPYFPETDSRSPSQATTTPSPKLPPLPPKPAKLKPLVSTAMSEPVASSPKTPVAPPDRPPSKETPSTPPTSRSVTAASAPDSPVIDYRSVEYTRARALDINTVPKVTVPSPDRAVRHRIAIERAAETRRVIDEREKEIETVRTELAEARHRLSDARMATKPAYDVRYEVKESARLPYAQIAIMAIISGALLQLLV